MRFVPSFAGSVSPFFYYLLCWLKPCSTLIKKSQVYLMIDFQENTLQLVTVLFLLSSAREGRREDIQDMLMEEEENRRKLLKKKSVAKRARFS